MHVQANRGWKHFQMQLMSLNENKSNLKLTVGNIAAPYRPWKLVLQSNKADTSKREDNIQVENPHFKRFRACNFVKTTLRRQLWRS